MHSVDRPTENTTFRPYTNIRSIHPYVQTPLRFRVSLQQTLYQCHASNRREQRLPFIQQNMK